MNKVICSNTLRNVRLLNSSFLTRATFLGRAETWNSKYFKAPVINFAEMQNIRFYTASVAGENAQKLDKTEKKTERYDFQAETKQLLNIVAKSLYSEKEVFIRELISNSSDAIEKLKYLQLSQAQSADNQNQIPFQIKLEANDMNNTLTIQVLVRKEEIQMLLFNLLKFVPIKGYRSWYDQRRINQKPGYNCSFRIKSKKKDTFPKILSIKLRFSNFLLISLNIQ